MDEIEQIFFLCFLVMRFSIQSPKPHDATVGNMLERSVPFEHVDGGDNLRNEHRSMPESWYRCLCSSEPDRVEVRTAIEHVGKIGA